MIKILRLNTAISADDDYSAFGQQRCRRVVARHHFARLEAESTRSRIVYLKPPASSCNQHFAVLQQRRCVFDLKAIKDHVARLDETVCRRIEKLCGSITRLVGIRSNASGNEEPAIRQQYS